VAKGTGTCPHPKNCTCLQEAERVVAVNQAIEASNRSGRKIGAQERKMIHGVLKGWRG